MGLRTIQRETSVECLTNSEWNTFPTFNNIHIRIGEREVKSKNRLAKSKLNKISWPIQARDERASRSTKIFTEVYRLSDWELWTRNGHILMSWHTRTALPGLQNIRPAKQRNMHSSRSLDRTDGSCLTLTPAQRKVATTDGEEDDGWSLEPKKGCVTEHTRRRAISDLMLPGRLQKSRHLR